MAILPATLDFNLLTSNFGADDADATTNDDDEDCRQQHIILLHNHKLLSTMRFPPSTKAAFFAALTTLSPSTAFSTARSSLAHHHQHASIRRSQLDRSSSTCAAAWATNNIITKQSLSLPLSLRGGSALLSTAAAEATAPKEIFRKDYKPLAFKVSNVEMNFDIRDGKTVVERCVLFSKDCAPSIIHI